MALPMTGYEPASAQHPPITGKMQPPGGPHGCYTYSYLVDPAS